MVYPNPNNGVFSVLSSTEIKSIELFDNLGLLISKPEIIDNNKISMMDLREGIYYLKVSYDKQYHMEKIIIY